MGPGRPNPEGPRSDSASGSADTKSNESAPDAPPSFAAPRADSRRLPTVAGYQIVNEIHRGGQGVVYKAVQLATHRVVALKVLLAGPFATEDQQHRFRREVDLAASLRHLNIVTIHDSGITQDGSRFLVMEYIDGLPISVFQSQQRLSVRKTLELVEKVCAAVNVAHDRGIVHRDLKPSNILVDAAGEPHIMDFGLAKLSTTGAEATEPVTRTGDFLGTYAYASPEQAAGNPHLIDVQTDVYALGVILFLLLTGDFPYPTTGPTPHILNQIIEAPSKTPSSIRGELGRDIDTIAMTALAREKSRRYATAGALGDDIGRYLAGEPIQARRDHVLYVAGKRLARMMSRNPRSVMAAAIIVAIAVSSGVGTPLVFTWTKADQGFEHFIETRIIAQRAESDFQHVRVIAIKDETDMPALARAHGIEGVSDYVKSWRRMHGALMQRLVRGRPRAVVSDIGFYGDTPHDMALAEGISALRKPGIPFVVPVKKWWFDESSLPPLSPAIVPLVKWGCSDAYFGEKNPWRVNFAAQRGGRVLPSLSLAAFALSRHPDFEPTIELDESNESAIIRYSRPHPDFPQAEETLDDVDRVTVRVQYADKNDPDFGTKVGDRFGKLTIVMPSDAILKRATIVYPHVFDADDAELRNLFEDRIVILADARSGVDESSHSSGRQLPRCYGHAAALEMALAGLSRPVPIPRELFKFLVLAVSAAIGMIFGVTYDRWTGRRCLALLVAAIVYAAAAVSLAAMLGIIWNPMTSYMALLIACELCAAARRLRPLPEPWPYLEYTK